MISAKEVEDAYDLLKAVVTKTPLQLDPYLSNKYQANIYLKEENLQKVRSFKLRGAYYSISKLSDEQRSKGVVCASAGNHAQGVAFAANQLNISATIFMPVTTPNQKISQVKFFGESHVTIRLIGDTFDESARAAKAFSQDNDKPFIDPFDDENVIAGQGTVALEIFAQAKKQGISLDKIFVQIGGGGLIAGIACAAKQINPNVKIYGVEPEGAASALAAIHEDQVVTLAEANTIADGTAVKTIGSKTFEYIKKYVDGIITVNDYELMDAFLLLVEKHKLVAEGSGILSLAGLKKLYEKNKKVVSLVSGGNIDVLTISSMINKGLISRGRIFTFSVQLPDKPGQLELVSKVLNQCNANVIAVDHNQFKNFARFSEVELRVTVETNGNSHIQTIIDEFAKLGYNIIKIN